MRRLATISLLAATITLLALPVLAQEGQQTPTTAPAAPAAETIQPAVVVPPPASGQTQQQWTYKYLVPLGLLLAAIVVFVTVVQYFAKVVRTRYTTTE